MKSNIFSSSKLSMNLSHSRKTKTRKKTSATLTTLSNFIYSNEMLNDLKLFSRLPVNSDKTLKHSHSANSEEYVKLYHSYCFDGIWFSNRSCHDFWHTNYFRSGTSRNSSKRCQRYQSHFSLHGQKIIFIRCYALAKSISFFFFYWINLQQNRILQTNENHCVLLFFFLSLRMNLKYTFVSI